MFKSVNYKISTTYITSNVKQTVVAVLSVTFGISMYVFMNSFMTGVNDSQNDLAFSTLAHVRIYNDGPSNHCNLAQRINPDKLENVRNSKIIQYTDGIKNSHQIVSFVQKQFLTKAVATQVNINVFFKSGSTKLNGILSGVDVENEDRLFGASNYVLQGEWSKLKVSHDGVIVGAGLAKTMGLKLNDNLNLLTSEGNTKNYKVIGIFQTTIASTDKTKAYINISAARQLLAKNQDYVTDIQINSTDYNQASVLANAVAPFIPYKVESWDIANGQLKAASNLRDIIAIAVSLTILLVAGFGIYNIMNMTVNQKIKEIAILKAMGFSGKDITEIFLTQAIIIGVLGGIVGMLFGYIAAALVNHVPFQIANLRTLPMAYNAIDYVLSFSFGLITTFIAGYLPAHKASRVDPVAIIRG